MLKVENLKKSYAHETGRTQVLAGIDLTMKSDETLALTGESGSGKSTLLHLVAGLDTADNGKILFEGSDVTQMDDQGRSALRREMIGVIFQQFNLIPSITVRSNIAFQARLADRFDADWADSLAQRIGLEDQLDKYPEALSGGQQQRVAIARTLAAKPKLVLADEPTGNLDETNAEKVLDLMLDIAKDAGTAVLMVTHSTHHASRLSRRLHLSHGQIVS